MKSLVTVIALALLAGVAGCDRFRSPEDRVKTAEEAMKAGDYRKAVVDLKNALEDKRDYDHARLLMAEAALWLGDVRGAATELGRIKGEVDPARRAAVEVQIALGQGKAEELLGRLDDPGLALSPAQRALSRGQALMQLGRFAEGEKAFDEAVAADSDLLSGKIGALEARAAQGDRAAAHRGYEALTKDSTNAELWLSYGLSLARTADFDAAVNALSNARKNQKQLRITQQAALFAALTDVQLARADVNGAADAANALQRVAGDSPMASLAQARVSMAKGDYTGAVTRLRELVRAAPKLVEARMLFAMALLAEGSTQQAGVELNTVLGQVPEHPGARQLLAQIRLQLDNPDGALRMLAPALESAPDDRNVNALVEAARSRLGAQASVSVLEEMLQQDPGNPGLEAQLASAYVAAGAADKAVALLKNRSGANDGDVSTADLRRAATLLNALSASQGEASVRREAEALVAANPGNGYLANLAASAYARYGDLNAARRVLQQALDRGANPASLLLSQAQLEWSAGNRPAAKAAIEKLMQLEPGNPAAQMAAGEMSLASQEFTAARKHFEKVLTLRPKTIDARLRLAQISLRAGAGKDADKLIEDAVALAPKRVEVRNAAGLLQLHFGRADQAAQQFRAATEADAKSAESWFNLSRAQLQLGQNAAARESLDQAVAAQPDAVPAQAALAHLDVSAGNVDAAIRRVDALKSANPDNPGVLVLSGDVLTAARRPADALKEYRAAYSKRADFGVAAKFFRVATVTRQREPTELVDRWLELHPDDAAARALLAESALQKGERSRAVTEYRSVLDKNPNDPVALNNLAWLYHEAGDSRALDLARKAAALAPQSAGVLDTLGWILVEQGKVAEGLGHLAKAVSGPKADPEVRYHYAAALARSNRAAEARPQLEQALSGGVKFPSRAAAEQLLAQLRSDSSATNQ